MDDEEILRDFLDELLELLGYDVSFGCDRPETIKASPRASEQCQLCDCILMDLTILGEMGGKEVIPRRASRTVGGEMNRTF